MVPQDGIADLSFQLSDEPLLGTYVINVTNGEAYDSFSVEDYGMSLWGICLSCRDNLSRCSRKLGVNSIIAILGANEKSNSIRHRKESELRLRRENTFWDLGLVCGSNVVHGPRPLTQLIPVDLCVRHNKVIGMGSQECVKFSAIPFLFYSLINCAGINSFLMRRDMDMFGFYFRKDQSTTGYMQIC